MRGTTWLPGDFEEKIDIHKRSVLYHVYANNEIQIGWRSSENDAHWYGEIGGLAYRIFSSMGYIRQCRHGRYRHHMTHTVSTPMTWLKGCVLNRMRDNMDLEKHEWLSVTYDFYTISTTSQRNKKAFSWTRTTFNHYAHLLVKLLIDSAW